MAPNKSQDSCRIAIIIITNGNLRTRRKSAIRNSIESKKRENENGEEVTVNYYHSHRDCN